MTETAYVDSNVFLLPVLGERSPRADGSTRALREVEAGAIVAYTSVLTWDEVVWVVTKVLGRDNGLQAGRKLFNFPGLRFVDVTPSVLAKAQDLCETSDLAPRDAIHCACALSRDVDFVISDDEDLRAASGVTLRRPDTFLPR